jgi:hypothetical protein
VRRVDGQNIVLVYADPGLSVGRGKGTFTLSVPVRMGEPRKSELEQHAA